MVGHAACIAVTLSALGWQAHPLPRPQCANVRAQRIARAIPRMDIEDDTFLVQSLTAMKSQYDELTTQLSDPGVVGDSDRFQRVSKERARLEKRVTVFDEYMAAKTGALEARELLSEESDPEIREMAKEEMSELEARQEELYKDLEILLLPSDPNDDKNVMIEIRSGAGGDEAAIWCGDLLKVYQKYAELQGWKVAPLTMQQSESGGFTQAVLEVKGDSVYSKLKYEAGVHRVQRVPATETQGRVHTSTATVAIMPEMTEVEVEIDPKEIQLCAPACDAPRGRGVPAAHAALADLG